MNNSSLTSKRTHVSSASDSSISSGSLRFLQFFFSFSFFNVGLMLEYFKLLGSGTVFYPFKMFALKLNKGELVWWSTSNIFMIDNFQGIWSSLSPCTLQILQESFACCEPSKLSILPHWFSDFNQLVLHMISTIFLEESPSTSSVTAKGKNLLLLNLKIEIYDT